MNITMINVLCTILGCVIGCISGISVAKKKSSEDGERIGMLTESLGFIKGQMSEMSRKLDDMMFNNQSFGERITACEESTKSAHKRIDNLERR